MPTYEYECTACGHQFERFQSMKEDPIRDCPSCAGVNRVKRLISAGSGLIFKGSGFYITDYKPKGGESTGSGENSKPASGDAKSDGKPAVEAGKPAASGTGESKPASSSSSTD